MKPSVPIVYVEDNPTDAEFLLRCFRRIDKSLPINHFGSGTEAQRYFRELVENNAPLPPLAIFDIKLPGISGLELLEYVRNDLKLTTLPIVLLSASYEERDIHQAYNNNTTAYLVKPDQYRQLKEMVNSIYLLWIRYNRIPLAAQSAT